jgi:predicted RNA-binding Zn-ribbon protein involved in translation (DUF1610 family)
MARYIDADKAIEEARLSYCKDCNSYNGVRCRACGFDDAMTYIEYTPTSDVVEVKHGKWEKPTLNLECFADGYVICSECNVMLPNITEIPEYYYCPNCGAKMDGGE